MKFTLTFSKQSITDARNQVIQSAAKNIKIKGFRQGKAPLNLVKEQLDPVKVSQAILEKVFPPELSKYLQDHDLHPIADPVVHKLETPEEGDWTAKVEIAQKPDVKLKDYQDAIKTLKAKDSIWTPGKSGPEVEPSEADNAQKRTEQLNKILEILLENAEVEIPQLVIDQDVNRQLSRLVEQVNRLGLNIDDYLAAQNTTAEKLRETYAVEADRSYRLEYILQAISKDLKIEVSDEELLRKANEIQNESTRHAIEHHPEEREYYRSLLVRQNTLDKLQSL